MVSVCACERVLEKTCHGVMVVDYGRTSEVTDNIEAVVTKSGENNIERISDCSS